MTRLYDIAKVLRSKNSGPFQVTLDILFESVEDFRRVAGSGRLTRERIAALYRLDDSDIAEIVFHEPMLGIKITYDRTGASSGTVGERDVYGAQQHAPLLDIEIP